MNAAFTPPSVIDQLLDTMSQADIVYDDKDPIVGDGKLHRFHVAGDASGDKNGWYCFHDDATPAGNFGCNKRFGPDVKLPFSAQRAMPLTAKEKAELAAKQAKQKTKRDAEDKARHEAAAMQAKAILANGKPITHASEHPYLERKDLEPHGALVGPYVVQRQINGVEQSVTVCDEALLLPIKINGQIVSLQAIFPDAHNLLNRDRDYLAGGERRGGHLGIGMPAKHNDREVYLLCEGYATGLALHHATQHGVVVAFDAGNLIHVARRVRAKCPEALIIIAADNDQWTTRPINNPGLHHAKLAADAVAGHHILPPFPIGLGEPDASGKIKGPTDFDDLRRLQGDEAVKAVVEDCLNALSSPDNGPQGPTPATAAPALPRPFPEDQQGTGEATGSDNLIVQDTLSSLTHAVGVVALGIVGKYYAFWRRSNGCVELIPKREIMQEAHLLGLADRTVWERWCLDGPGCFDRSYIANHLTQVCKHLGDAKPDRVPRQLATPASVEQALMRAQLIEMPSAALLAGVLCQHPAWQGVDIWHNQLSTDIHCHPAPPCGGEAGVWQDRHDQQLSAWVTHRLGVTINARVAADAIELIANQSPRHPVREYLNALSWDGVPRLDRWLTACAGVAESPYSRAVGAKTLIAAVARAMKPGCKVDTMLILEGPQGLRKSSLIAALVPDEAWFADDLGADIGDKDAQQGMRGKWIVEFAEMANMARSQVRKVKQFLSSRVDRYRPSYGHRTQDFPRQVIFIGTINPEGGGGYLADRTGGRRFWPVVCQRIDLARMQTERDQLWAEAVARYRQEEPWWLDSTTEALAKEEQAARQFDNPWADRVSRFIEDLPPEKAGACWGDHRAAALTVATTSEVFKAFEGREPCARDMKDSKLISNAFVELGWTQGKQTLLSGRRGKCWRAPSS